MSSPINYFLTPLTEILFFPGNLESTFFNLIHDIYHYMDSEISFEDRLNA